MRSARLDFADPECPVSLADVDPPRLPNADWARVRITAGGICGSDLHAIFPDGSGTPTFLPLSASRWSSVTSSVASSSNRVPTARTPRARASPSTR